MQCQSIAKLLHLKWGIHCALAMAGPPRLCNDEKEQQLSVIHCGEQEYHTGENSLHV